MKALKQSAIKNPIRKRHLLHVKIADVKFSIDDQILKTTLGSCVSVIMYSNEGTCSMSHYLLPRKINARLGDDSPNRFGEHLLKVQLENMKKLGANLKNTNAKIAGGAVMFENLRNSPSLDIGKRNIEFAKFFLFEHKIPIITSDVGGTTARSIEFDPLTKMMTVFIGGVKKVCI